MDFVVIGLGLSALALLTGLTLLCLVAPRWFRKAGAAQPGDVAYAQAQAGERHALGQGFLCVGAVLLLTTLGGISAGLSDRAGAYLVASVTTLAALGVFGWDLLYRRQHPVPRRRRAAPVQKTPATAGAMLPATPALPSPGATTTTARRRVLPARQRVMPAAQPAANATSPELPGDDEHPSGDEGRPAEALEHGTDLAETLAGPDGGVEPAAADNQAKPEINSTAVAEPIVIDEPGRDASDAGEPAVVAAVLPEPVPLRPARANGAADLDASSTTGTEPEMPPHGDDRVIALFPTAAARRGRTIIAPTDSDGQG